MNGALREGDSPTCKDANRKRGGGSEPSVPNALNAPSRRYRPPAEWERPSPPIDPANPLDLLEGEWMSFVDLVSRCVEREGAWIWWCTNTLEQLMQCTATGDERDAIEGRHAAVMSRARLALVCKRWHVVLEADCLVREVVPGHANQVISPERATSIETARNLHWSAHRTRFQREFASVFEAVPDLLHSLYMGDHCPFLTAATGLVCERLAYYFGRGELVGKVSAGTKWSPLTADDLVKAGWTTPVDHWDFLSGLSPHGHDVTVPGTRWHGVRFRMTSAADARSMSKTPELKREAAAGKLKEMVKTYYFKNKEAFDYATRGQKTPRYTKH